MQAEGERIAVFVTVGNATQGFNRLLEAVDRLAGEGFFGGETVLVQAGNNPNFQPIHCKCEAFLPMEEFVARVHDADLIITHAGAGTLFHVLQAGKVAVVMPRREKYREHVDDHQVELVEALAAEGRVIPAYEPSDLPVAIAEARKRGAHAVPPGPSRMLNLVGRAIEELMRQ